MKDRNNIEGYISNNNDKNFFKNNSTLSIKNTKIVYSKDEPKLSDFDFTDRNTPLGKGNFGEVHKVSDKISGNFFALKRITRNALNKDQRSQIKKEALLMKNLQHAHIVQFYSLFEEKDSYYFVLELIEGENLQKFISKKKPQPLDQKLVLIIFYQILDAIQYLHEKQIIHRDIKPDNIMIDKKGFIKVTDFGISGFKKNEIVNQVNNLGDEANKSTIFVHSSFIGHKDYVCPEITKHKSYDEKSDIYSLGLTMFELMTYNLPFYSIYNKETGIIYRTPNYVEISEKIYDKELIGLVKEMLKENPNFRPSAKDTFIKLKNIINRIDNNLFIKINQIELNLVSPNNNYERDGEEKLNVPEGYISNNEGGFSIFNQNKEPENFVPPFTRLNSDKLKPIQVSVPFSPINQFNYSNSGNIRMDNNKFYTLIQILFNHKKIREIFLESEYWINKIKNANYQSQLVTKNLYSVIQELDEIIKKKLPISTSIEKTLDTFRKNLGNKLVMFSDEIDEVSIQDILILLLRNLNEEFRNFSSWNNNIFKKLNESMIPFKVNEFPDIYTEINKFKTEYQTIFVDEFYFLIFKKYKCANPNCQNIINCTNTIEYYLTFDMRSYTYWGGGIQFLSMNNLLLDFEKEKIIENVNQIYCYRCQEAGQNIILTNKLFSTPPTLMIFFENVSENDHFTFEEYINLGNHIITNIGPRSYELFALIFKEGSGNQTFGYVKDHKSKTWKLCFNNNYIDYSFKEITKNKNAILDAAIYVEKN